MSVFSEEEESVTYDDEGNPAPWSSFEVKNLVIEDGEKDAKEVLDLAGYEKPLYYQRRALWTKEPFVRIAVGDGQSERHGVWNEHFRWMGEPGQTKIVSCYTNAKAVELFLIPGSSEDKESLQTVEEHIRKLANVSEVVYLADHEGLPGEVMSAVITGAEVFVPLEDLVDFAAEIERLTKEKAKLEGEVARSEKMLSNPGFVNKAPEAKVQQEKDKMADYKEKLAKVTDRLAAIQDKA